MGTSRMCRVRAGPLVMDLHISLSVSEVVLTIILHLHYPNDIDMSLNEDTGYKIRKDRQC
jgi:hypothetical protein